MQQGNNTTYTWDSQNRLVEVETADGTQIIYEYDDSNICTSQTVDGVTTDYVVDSNRPYAQVLAEYTDGEF